MNREIHTLHQLKSQLRYYQRMAVKEPNLIDWGACIKETTDKIKNYG